MRVPRPTTVPISHYRSSVPACLARQGAGLLLLSRFAGSKLASHNASTAILGAHLPVSRLVVDHHGVQRYVFQGSGVIVEVPESESVTCVSEGIGSRWVRGAEEFPCGRAADGSDFERGVIWIGVCGYC